jgi:hypothetical protein
MLLSGARRCLSRNSISLGHVFARSVTTLSTLRRNHMAIISAARHTASLRLQVFLDLNKDLKTALHAPPLPTWGLVRQTEIGIFNWQRHCSV